MARSIRIDAGTLQKPRRTSQGYLRVDGWASRTGILEYRNPDGSIRRELREPDAVFNEDALTGFEGAPVTDDHPSSMVDLNNAKTLTKGTVLSVGRRDGDHVAVSLVITDPDLIRKVESGKRQLSTGYYVEMDETPGVHPQYGRYDARQVRVGPVNHLAIVDRGRAGTASLRMDSADLDALVQVDDLRTRLDSISARIDALRARRDAEWDESLHPRDENGRFGSGGDTERNRDFDSHAPHVANSPKKQTDYSKPSPPPLADNSHDREESAAARARVNAKYQELKQAGVSHEEAVKQAQAAAKKPENPVDQGLGAGRAHLGVTKAGTYATTEKAGKHTLEFRPFGTKSWLPMGTHASIDDAVKKMNAHADKFVNAAQAAREPGPKPAENAAQAAKLPAPKLPTYAQAQQKTFKTLADKGWTVKSNLKVPHATSPDGQTRLWFKPQAVWKSEGNAHALKGASSTFEDLREHAQTDEKLNAFAERHAKVRK